MFQCLLSAVLTLSFIFNINTSQEYLSIKKYFSRANDITIVCDNIYYNCDNYMEEKITNTMYDVCKDSHDIPALSISIHEETMKNLQQNMWLIFKYSKTQYHSEIPFDELLIEVNPNYYGFNIIRKYRGKYEGRCFYITLNNDMRKLYDCINTLIMSK